MGLTSGKSRIGSITGEQDFRFGGGDHDLGIAWMLGATGIKDKGRFDPRVESAFLEL